MVIYAAPKDPDWIKVSAFLKVLALDPRLKREQVPSSYRGLRPVDGDIVYVQSADDILVRPMVMIDHQKVLADYWSYTLRFNVNLSVHGSIPVSDAASLDEFKRVVNEAIQGALTQAEIQRWKATEEHVKGCYRKESTEHWIAKAKEAGHVADQHYKRIVELLMNRPAHPSTGASRYRFEEVLDWLLNHGMTMLNA